MNGEMIDGSGEEIHEVDLEIDQVDDSTGSMGMTFGVVLAAIAALVVGAILITSTGGGDEVDVAAEESTEDAGDAGEDADADVTSPTTTWAPDDEEFEPTMTTVYQGDAMMEESDAIDYAADAAYDIGGPGGSSMVFVDGKFVGLTYGPNGAGIRTSTDGLEWEFVAIDGLPDDSQAMMIAEHDGTIAAVFQTWTHDETTADDDVELYFGSPSSQGHVLAVTTDLESWSTSELDLANGDDSEAYVQAMALGDAGIAIVAHRYQSGPDEMRILYEAGLLTEENFENYCGLDIGETSIDVLLCDYSRDIEEPSPDLMEDLERAYEAAETDAEREAIERQFEELHGHQTTVLTTVTPADAVFNELSQIYDYANEGDESLLLAGPIAGPLAVATPPGGDEVTSLVEFDGSFVLASIDYGSDGADTTIHTSANGLVWTKAGAVPGHGQLAAIGNDVLVLFGQTFDAQVGDESLTAFASTDGGATWSESTLGSDLFAAYPMMATGPAGAVAVITGYDEAPPGYDVAPINVVERDGYTLTINIDEEGLITLVGPDGDVIHSLTEAELEATDDGSGNIPGVVRTNPLTDTPTFLDPDTGEDLVTFTQEDFESSYSMEEEMAYEEPAQRTEILFSSDGSSWSEIDDDRLNPPADGNAHVSLVGVGDDEAIFARHTWVEPPREIYAFEEEGREPTDEEIAILEEWEVEANGGDSTEFIRIELG